MLKIELKVKNKGGKTSHFIDFCIIFTVTIILLLILELLCFAAVSAYTRYTDNKNFNQQFDLPENDLLHEVMKDELSIKPEYSPYVGYDLEDLRSEHVNILNNTRLTTNNCVSGNSVDIWFFGGSAAWGSPVPDESTIPSLISKKLCDKGISVKITNMAVGGYVTTQEAMKYFLQLRQRSPPDIAVFYDGWNDVTLAYNYGEAGMPADAFHHIIELNPVETNEYLKIIRNTNTMKVIRKLLQASGLKKQQAADEIEKEKLISDIVSTYAGNFNLVKGLSDQHDTSYYFFFQPTVFSKDMLSQKEMEYYKQDANFLRENGTYEKISFEISKKLESPNFISMADVFDRMNSTIFVDSVHKGIRGNELEADFIISKIKPEIMRKAKSHNPASAAKSI